MGMNLENNNAILLNDVKLETQVKQNEIINDNKIIYKIIKRFVDIKDYSNLIPGHGRDVR